MKDSPSGFTMVEVVVASALVLLISSIVSPASETIAKREKEERLRQALWEMREGIERYRQDNGSPPTSLQQLLAATAPSPIGGFYLRRLPLNPFVASTQWEIASPIIDVRCPDPATGTANQRVSPGTGTDGIAYRDW